MVASCKAFIVNVIGPLSLPTAAPRLAWQALCYMFELRTSTFLR